MPDRSSGYEAIATHFIGAGNARTGPEVVRAWAKGLPRGGAVPDIGCGHGVPITEALIEDGFEVLGVDASPTLVAAFRERFPGVHVECNGIEDSAFFGRNFEGVVAWGMLFLPGAEGQRALIGRMEEVLKPGLVPSGNDTDEGRNYYYFATKS